MRFSTIPLILITVCLLAALPGNSQNRPNILFEDIEQGDLSIKCLCKPGIRNKSKSKGLEIYYNLLGGGELSAPNFNFFSSQPEYQQFRKFRAKITLPIVRSEAFKMLVGMSYQAEQYEFRRLEADFENILAQIDNRNFKSTAFNLTMSYSLNEINYLGLRYSTRYNGAYSGFISTQSRYAINTAALAFGIKKTEDEEWGIGVAFSETFRSSGFRVLPFVFWNKNIDHRFGIEATFPAEFYTRYNLNPKTILLGGFNFNGESYSFDQQIIDRQLSFNHTELQFLLKCERQLFPWVWLNAAGGFQFNFNSNFEVQSTQRDLLTVSPENTWYFRIGLFLSPPDSFLK